MTKLNGSGMRWSIRRTLVEVAATLRRLLPWMLGNAYVTGATPNLSFLRPAAIPENLRQ